MNHIHTFDESMTAARLKSYDEYFCAAFALACTTRLFNCVIPLPAFYGPVETIICSGWIDCIDRIYDPVRWQRDLKAVMDLIELDPNESSFVAVILEDLLAATAYFLRFLLYTDIQEAVWSARRAHELADQAAIVMLEQDGRGFPPEAIIGAHTIVQTELLRQAVDVEDLARGCIEAVRDRALRESCLTPEQLKLIKSGWAARGA